MTETVTRPKSDSSTAATQRVYIREASHARLAKLAELENRTLGAQAEVLIDKAFANRSFDMQKPTTGSSGNKG